MVINSVLIVTNQLTEYNFQKGGKLHYEIYVIPWIPFYPLQIYMLRNFVFG